MDTNSREPDDHGVETRSLPRSLAATLTAFPSVSLLPAAPLHGCLQNDSPPPGYGVGRPASHQATSQVLLKLKTPLKRSRRENWQNWRHLSASVRTPRGTARLTLTLLSMGGSGQFSRKYAKTFARAGLRNCRDRQGGPALLEILRKSAQENVADYLLRRERHRTFRNCAAAHHHRCNGTGMIGET
jgi:hypothetical protein